jgi:hypothetical protein
MMLAAETHMLVFRLLRTLGGVLWVGSTFLFSACQEGSALRS